MTQSSAFVLLNIPNVQLTAGEKSISGLLSLECVTIANPEKRDPNAPNRDVYLVLSVAPFETPLDPSRPIQCTVLQGVRHYTFVGGNGEDVSVAFREPSSEHPHLQEDLDTFDSILSQYAEFTGPQPFVASHPALAEKGDLRGHVVLVNEDNGEVLGDFDRRYVVQEDPRMNEKGREKEPVIIEIPEDEDEDGDAQQVFVRAVPPGEGDIITKGASFVSYAISGTTNLLLSAMTSAADYTIKHTDPHPSANPSSSRSPDEPPPLPPRALVLLTSERTRKGLSTVHALSGQAVQVSTKTLGMLDSMIQRVVGDKGKQKEVDKVASPKPAHVTTLSPPTSMTPNGRSQSPGPVPPPPYVEKPPLPPRSPGPSNAPPLPPRGEKGSGSPAPSGSSEKLGTKDRLMLSAGLILSTLDTSAKQLLDVGGQQIEAVVGHKYGAKAAHSTSLLTGTAKNVGLVYVDMRGIGRVALVKRVGKQYVKTRSAKSKAKSQAEAQEKNLASEGEDIVINDYRTEKK